MSKVALLNILVGFLAILLASCGGFFVAFETGKAFASDGHSSSWFLALLSASHGHTNLFGMLHILFGLSLPYSSLKPAFKKWQTTALCLGTFSMSFLMVLRAFMFSVPGEYELVGVLSGLFLLCSLLAIATHCYGLAYKLLH